MKKSQKMKLFELDYSDLLQLSSAKYESLSSEEFQRLQMILERVIENLGPTGPGLIAVKSVPGASILRGRLLPLARKLALLDNDDRKLILKEHNLGSDVSLKNLDRIVSSFIMQLKYENLGFCESFIEEEHGTPSINDTNNFNSEFENLGSDFKKLGFLMMKIGLCLSQICDKSIGTKELEKSLLESCSAKGRLIHYHSMTDNLIIKEAAKIKKTRKGNVLDKECCKSNTDFWQQWHYDYGIFTVLTSPLFMQSSDQECQCQNGNNTCLQIFHPEKDDVYQVTSSPESFIVQVGESADVLSKGMLRATLHCVSRSLEIENISRQTFVVFLQPAWNKILSFTGYNHHQPPPSTDFQQLSVENENDNGQLLHRLEDLHGHIHNVVPPLTLRLKDGMTFAEFSRETTKRYYGGSGLQSKP